MDDANVRLLFSTIDDFMETQASPSTSMIEQFPWLVRLIPKPLQWYRPKAERVYRKTIGLVFTPIVHIFRAVPFESSLTMEISIPHPQRSHYRQQKPPISWRKIYLEGKLMIYVPNSVYKSFLDELEQRINQGEDPQCFARDMIALADKYGFDAAQKYFCGEFYNFS